MSYRHCHQCGTELETVKNEHDETCIACERVMSDRIFEALVGHKSCQVCDIHVCYDCHLGPLKLADRRIPAKEVARVFTSGFSSKSTAREKCGCATAPCVPLWCREVFATSTESQDTGCNVEVVWSSVGEVQCLQCDKRARAADVQIRCNDCELPVTTSLLGSPRAIVDRRRPRSPSPQNIKREPSSSSSDEDEEEKPTQQSKTKKSAPPKRSSSKRK